MEGESHNLQNDFFNEARKAKTQVTVFLNTGKKLSGRIKSFDKFTLLLETYQGELIVFKHAISTVSLSGRANGPGEGDRNSSYSGGRGGAGRPND
jgi:host factor-I protein